MISNKTDEHKQKMIAPVVITVLVVIYYIIYFGLILEYVSGILSIIFGIIPLIFSIVMIYVCIQRITEIKGGEEDDLSNY